MNEDQKTLHQMQDDEEEEEFDHTACQQVPREACYWCRQEREGAEIPYTPKKEAEFVGKIRI